MATRIATADGNFTTAGTWGVVDATALLDSEANNTALTTSYVESAGFTPGAITIDGIAVKVASRAASPSGTISIRLAQAGATVAGTEVTINVSDIESRAGEQGWYFFKFAAPVLLLAATVYTVSAKTSAATQVNLYRNATAGNWSRMLRTTTTGAPGAGDNLHILGEWTAAATKTNRAVTMDSTATTDYGDNTAANPPQFTIGKGGTLTWGATAATAYILRISGKLYIYIGGTMTMGTTGTPMPRDSSAELQFDGGAADGDFGLVVFGSFTAQGLSRSSGKNIVQCKLNTDEAAGQTTLGVDTDTGWLSGDDIGIASTTRTVTQAEARTLNGDAGATSLAVTAGLTNAHSGTSPTQAEVILLSRNVRIVSTSTTLMSYCLFGEVATVDCDWVLFRYMGASASGKRGVEINTTTGSCTLDFCAVRNFDNHGILVSGASAANFYIRNCVGFNVGSQGGTHAGIAVISAVTSTAWEVSDCTIICGTAVAGYAFHFLSLEGVVQRLIGACAQTAGFYIDLDTLGGRIEGTASDWTAHSCGQHGIAFDSVVGGRINTLTAWRCNGTTQQGGVSLLDFVGELTIDGLTLFGNNTQNIACNSACQILGEVRIRNGVFAGDSTFATANGFVFPPASGRAHAPVIFENCTFGVAAGIHVAHSTADIDFTANTDKVVDLVLRNTLLASGTEFANRTTIIARGRIRYQKQDQVANDHLTDYPALGTIEYESTIFHGSAPSEKLTPSGATAALRLRSQIRRIPVESGQAMAVSVWVRKSAAYAGSTVRLLLLSNAAIGITDDTVLDSMTAAADTWEQLSGTTVAVSADGVLEVCIEVDGSAGIVYVDDWAAAA